MKTEQCGMRALIADDHSIIRMALRHILRELDAETEVVEAASGKEALALLGQTSVDMVITDLVMPGGGVHSLEDLVQAADGAPVVVFTVSEQPEDVRRALAAGARAYVPKTTADNLIVNILRLVAAGGVYAPPQLTTIAAPNMQPPLGTPGMSVATAANAAAFSAVMGGGRGDGASQPLPQLTRRQYQVLELLAQGLSNADIGERLNLNLSTVKSHVTGVLRALGVSSRTQAVLAFKQSEWTRVD